MESKNSSHQKQGQLSSLTYMTNCYIARTGRAFGAPTLETLARGVVFGLLALTIAPFVLTTPAHAADDNTVSIAVDQNAALQPSGNLYKATTNVTVKTGKPYGFNLVMQTATRSSDLINSNNSTRHIYGASYHNMATELSANQWGYALNRQTNKFTRVPSHNDTPAVIADVTKTKSAGCTNPANCTKSITFAANVDPAKLASGSYSTVITYTATAKPAPKPPVVDPTTCKSGDPQNDCQVDLDPNMIPVKYTGTTTNAQWTSLAKPEDAAHQGEWYDYKDNSKKDTKWANAVTVKDPSKYKNQTRVVDQSDILGYWVYIPRYAYEVMRRDGTDKPVPAQNFLIQFEKTTTPKRVPAACPEKGEDYRTECGLNRDYIKGQPSNQGTWATHPAFTFGSKELNGIWFAKFETTGTNTQPTVLPNERHIEGVSSGIQYIGGFYALAKTMGVNDPNNVGGNASGVYASQNNHHLVKLSSHMVNNNDWGTATYLSASKYGAGYNGVQINANSANHNNSYGTTGCGPWENGSTDTYRNDYASDRTHKISIGALGTQQACGEDDTQRAYNGTLGQLASTTNNPTGIYDMSGGSDEYVAASYSYSLNNSNANEYFGSNAAHPPYVNTYNFDDLDNCTFATCGGQALHETAQWNGSYTEFVTSYSPWVYRSSGYSYGLLYGLFYVFSGNGAYSNFAFRVALAPVSQD